MDFGRVVKLSGSRFRVAANYRIGAVSIALILCYQFIYYLSQKTSGKMR